MKCPHCSVENFPATQWQNNASDLPNDPDLMVAALTCPKCKRLTLTIEEGQYISDGPDDVSWLGWGESIIWPRVSGHPPIPLEVPEPYASLAKEAGLILNDSPRASAMLSRRCLQQLLRTVAGAPAGTLYDEIEWTLAKANLPSHLQEGLHDLREIGNMGAHPNKNKATGDELEVEPGEAEWSLDVIDGLLDFYFVQPAKTKARREALAVRLGKVSATATPAVVATAPAVAAKAAPAETAPAKVPKAVKAAKAAKPTEAAGS